MVVDPKPRPIRLKLIRLKLVVDPRPRPIHLKLIRLKLKGLDHGLREEFWTRCPFLLLLLQLGDESHEGFQRRPPSNLFPFMRQGHGLGKEFLMRRRFPNLFPFMRQNHKELLMKHPCHKLFPKPKPNPKLVLKPNPKLVLKPKPNPKLVLKPKRALG